MHGSALNRRALESLIKAGAFDGLEPSRHGMLESVEAILKIIENDARQNLEGQLDLFSALSGEDAGRNEDYTVPRLAESGAGVLLKRGLEVAGL